MLKMKVSYFFVGHCVQLYISRSYCIIRRFVCAGPCTETSVYNYSYFSNKITIKRNHEITVTITITLLQCIVINFTFDSLAKYGATLICRFSFHTVIVFSQPFRPTQPGQPSVGTRSDNWRWFHSHRGEENTAQQRNSRPYFDDCWRTGPLAVNGADVGRMLA